MTIEQLTVFLGWSTVINAGLMLWAKLGVIFLNFTPYIVLRLFF